MIYPAPGLGEAQNCFSSVRARVLRVSGGNPRRSLAGIPPGVIGADPAISRSSPLPLTLRTQERNDGLEAIQCFNTPRLTSQSAAGVFL